MKPTTTIVGLHDDRMGGDYLDTLKKTLENIFKRENMLIAVATRSTSTVPVLNQLVDLAAYLDEVPPNHGQILVTAYMISIDPTAKDQMIELLDGINLATEMWDCLCRFSRFVHLHGTILDAVGHSSHFALLGVVCLSKAAATKPKNDDASDEEANE
jgi:hypothetical protein